MTEKVLLETLQISKVNVIAPNEVKSSSGYKLANENKNMKKGNNIAIDGYKLIAYNDKTIVSELSGTLGLKGVMFVNCVFDKFMESGLGKNGKMGAAVTLNIFILNEKNKVVLQKSFFGQSKNTTAIIGGVYSPEELMNLFPEAIKNASDEFQQSIEM